MAEESLQGTPKAAWQRPENWVAWGGLALVGYAALQGLDYILPLLNRVLENLVYTSVLAGVLAVVGWMAVNKDFHKLAWYGYKMAMRWVTERFVAIDPVAILQTYVEGLKDKYEQITKSLAMLKKQRQSLTDLIERKSQGYEQSMRRADQARKLEKQDGSMHTEFQLQARKAGRLQQSTTTFQGLLNQLNRHIALTEKIKEASHFMIEDIEDTVEEETEKRNTIRESYKAMSASRRIIMAGKEGDLYDAALENIKDDYFQKLGEIDQFMDDSQSFINSMDLQKGEFDEDALQKLNAWDGKRSLSLLEGGSGKTKFRVGRDGAADEADPVSATATDPKRQSFADMFKD